MRVTFAIICYGFVLTVHTKAEKDDKIYLLEVRLPTLEYRDEAVEIKDIHKLLRQSRGVRTLYAFKVVGEPLIMAVLKVTYLCAWEKITTTLMYMGEEIKVKPLYFGEDFATDLGINETVIGQRPESLPNDNLYLWDSTFFIEGNTTSYMATIKKNVEGGFLFRKRKDVPMVVVKLLSEVPVRVVGEPRILAVLKIRWLCAWKSLTDILMDMGEDIYVKSLYWGENLAEDLGINSTLITEPPASLPDENLRLWDITFSTQGKNTSAYMATVKTNLANSLKLRQREIPVAAFKVMSDIPVRMLYFANFPPANADKATIDFDGPNIYTATMTTLQNLRSYC